MRYRRHSCVKSSPYIERAVRKKKKVGKIKSNQDQECMIWRCKNINEPRELQEHENTSMKLKSLVLFVTQSYEYFINVGHNFHKSTALTKDKQKPERTMWQAFALCMLQPSLITVLPAVLQEREMGSLQLHPHLSRFVSDCLVSLILSMDRVILSKPTLGWQLP